MSRVKNGTHLPHSQEAEAGVLGGVLLDNANLGRLRDLQPDHLYDPKHRVVFQAIRNLEAANKPIDVVTLEAEIGRSGKLEAIGGVGFLGELVLRVPTADNVSVYAEIIRDHHLTRRTRVMVADVLAEAAADQRGGQDLVKDLRAGLDIVESSAGRPARGEQSDSFQTMSERLEGEAEERVSMGKKRLRYFVPFMDDYLRAICPHDLVIIGAPPGTGKTDISLGIGASNARLGKVVHYYALEAESRELERRTKFTILTGLLTREQHPGVGRMNYTDWLLGDLEDICGPHNAAADRIIREKLATMHTYYRGAEFSPSDLRRSVKKIHSKSDLIIIDHLHYIDTQDDNEARAIGRLVKTIRDISLAIGVPIILVSHLRKRDQRSKQLTIQLDDFHGSSEISKIGTQVIGIERANVSADKWYLSPTFMTVLKDRRSGACPLVALTNYDRRSRSYSSHYGLGVGRSGEWEEIPQGDVPTWAKHQQATTMPVDNSPTHPVKSEQTMNGRRNRGPDRW